MSNKIIVGMKKYDQLIEIMKTNISTGLWETDLVIPSERELAETFGVNRITVRKAISYLKQKGYLHSAEKRGTYVLPKKNHDAYSLYSFSDDIKRNGQTPGQVILEFGYVPISELVRLNLHIPLSVKEVLRIKRIRFSDTTPIGIQISYINLKPKQKLHQEELEESGSLYALLEKKYSITMVEAYESIGGRLPSETEKKHLELGVNEVVITSSRITYSKDGTPFEYVEMVYPASRYVYKIKISKDTFEY